MGAEAWKQASAAALLSIFKIYQTRKENINRFYTNLKLALDFKLNFYKDILMTFDESEEAKGHQN